MCTHSIGQNSVTCPHLIAKEARKCCLASCPRRRRIELSAQPASFHHRPPAPSPPPASGLPMPLLSLIPILASALPTPSSYLALRSPVLQLPLATSQQPRKDQSRQVREAHRAGLFLMSLHNQHTEQKVRVQTAWGEGGGPLRPLSLWSSSLGTQQVLNMGSCGPTVHVSSSRKEAGGWGWRG